MDVWKSGGDEEWGGGGEGKGMRVGVREREGKRISNLQLALVHSYSCFHIIKIVATATITKTYC